mgnify:CR=1 FL=1
MEPGSKGEALQSKPPDAGVHPNRSATLSWAALPSPVRLPGPLLRTVSW